MRYNEAEEFCKSLGGTVGNGHETLTFLTPYWTKSSTPCTYKTLKGTTKRSCTKKANVICEIDPIQPVIHSPCPSNWIHNPRTSACYYTANDIKRWSLADKFCWKITRPFDVDGHIVTIHNERENEFVAKLASKTGNKNAYLGAIGNPSDKKLWSWFDNTYFPSYSNWGEDQPNSSYKTSTILVMNVTSKQWYNYHPTRVLEDVVTICKFDL
ncbi:unnamed protein product [Bursaphelenchus okinawaensis]|uniref:C-type lectin domain-containing protein n=1 Tax=Bursaphelenchus okinawaensis TaxID=465554 RepID=A0A811JV67_9BILA|nr:unnamed protein product [Bursaphelenchus okinawaensis]CAG9084464.1 unnamed protein product [Bursaphelenchus okinawaensis]